MATVEQPQRKAQGSGPDFSRKKLAVKLDDNRPLLYLDIDKIKQVILKLSIHSSHAMESAGSIRLSADFAKTGNCCINTVKDTCRGITKDEQTKFSTRFQAPDLPVKNRDRAYRYDVKSLRIITVIFVRQTIMARIPCVSSPCRS